MKTENIVSRGFTQVEFTDQYGDKRTIYRQSGNALRVKKNTDTISHVLNRVAGELTGDRIKLPAGVTSGSAGVAPGPSDPTCYIERSKVREILLGQPDESLYITEEILREVDALPIFTAEDFRHPAQTLPAHFADAYTAARKLVSNQLADEIVSRNAGDDTSRFYRPKGEDDAEFARRIVATYLALASTDRGGT